MTHAEIARKLVAMPSTSHGLAEAIEAALTAAHREGIEQSALICEAWANKTHNSTAANLAYDIRALLREALTPKPTGPSSGVQTIAEALGNADGKDGAAATAPSPSPLDDDGWRDLQMDPPPCDGRQKIFICRNGSIFVADHIEAKEISVSERRKIYEATGEWPSADWTPTHWRRPPSPPGQR